jgi:hypothetical protein
VTLHPRQRPWEREAEPLVIGPVWGPALPDDADPRPFELALPDPFPWTESSRPQDTAAIEAVDSAEAWGRGTLGAALLERHCGCTSRGRSCS